MRIVLLMALFLAGQTLGSWDADAKAKAQALAWGVEKCSPRIVTANFSKHGWSKTTWGPPTNVDFDVLKTNSILWPYQIVVAFTIQVGATRNRKNREEAEQDTKPDIVFKLSYKNVYEMGDDGGIRLGQTLDLPISLNGPSSWRERTRLPDACWDHLPKRSKPTALGEHRNNDLENCRRRL